MTVPGRAGVAPSRWRFATPAPKLVQKYPEDVAARRDALVFVEFDQRVEPEAVLRALKLQAGAGAPLAVRRATEDEISRDENVKRLVASAPQGRWLAFRAEGTLPPISPVSVVVGAGTPSAEGPRRTTAPQSFSFRTYGPFRVTKHACGWNNRCSPGDPWQVEFSNPLDAEAFDSSLLKVEPEVPGLNISVYGQTLYIQGSKRGRTTRWPGSCSVRSSFNAMSARKRVSLSHRRSHMRGTQHWSTRTR